MRVDGHVKNDGGDQDEGDVDGDDGNNNNGVYDDDDGDDDVDESGEFQEETMNCL